MGVRWVDVGKSTGADGSRLVAQDLRPKSRVWDVMGFFVVLPLVDLVISAAAERCRSGYPEKMVMIDVLKAHLHAAIAGSVYVNFLSPRTSTWEIRQTPGNCAECDGLPGSGRTGRWTRGSGSEGRTEPLRQQDAGCSIGNS